MARPKTEDGFTQLANEIVDQLCQHRIPGQEMQIVWAVIRRTWSWRKKTQNITFSELKKMTGIDRRKCYLLMTSLIEKNIIVRKVVTHIGDKKIITYGIQKDYEKWKLSPKRRAATHIGDKLSSNRVTSLPPKRVTPTIKEKYKERIKEKDPACIKKFVDLFNQLCPSLPTVRDITKSRKEKIGLRLSSDSDMQFWEDIFKSCEKSDFLSGRASDWRASFDWIMKPSNLQKIKEGTYDNKKGSQSDMLEKLREVKARYS